MKVSEFELAVEVYIPTGIERLALIDGCASCNCSDSSSTRDSSGSTGSSTRSPRQQQSHQHLHPFRHMGRYLQPLW